MNKQVFAGVCSVLSMLPSNVAWNDDVATMYAIAMKGWDDAVVGLVARHVLYNCEWRPSVAELRMIAIKLVAPKLNAHAIHNELSRIISIASEPSRRDELIETSMELGNLPPYTKQLIERAGGWMSMGSRSTDYNLQFIQDFIKDNWSSYQLDTLITNAPENQLLLEEGTQMVKALLDK